MLKDLREVYLEEATFEGEFTKLQRVIIVNVYIVEPEKHDGIFVLFLAFGKPTETFEKS